MKFAIVILAVLAVVCAQDNGKYTPYNVNPYNYNPYNYNPYNYNRNYNNYGPYEPYNRQPYYNPQDYYRAPYNPYYPAAPVPFVPPTFVPSTIAPPVIPVVPKVVPVIPKVVPVVPKIVPVIPKVVPVIPKVVPVPVVNKVVPNGAEANAQILRYDSDSAPDGSYAYAYETSNGIAAQEQGTPKDFGGNPPNVPDVAQGSFTWTSPEGRTVAISYVADENGYQPVGDAIPTPPPVPPQIVRSLEFNAANSPSQ